MNYTDFDLDTYNRLKDLPEDNAVLYFRAGVEGVDDFFYAKGVIADLGEVLGELMKQNEDLEMVVVEAVKHFQE